MSAHRRALLGAAGLALALPKLAAAAPPSTPAPSPAPPATCHPATDWVAFAARHIQADGRVIDFNTPQQQSTSEGQSYGMFFALVHNDRPAFARMLAWTEANLAGGSLAKKLPAWQWGRKPEGGWGVLDPNAASDADLWIAYALMEGGRLWNDAGYRALGRSLLALAVREEVVALPGLGRMLLPWPKSVASGTAWRLNPSYMPLQLLRYFQQAQHQQGGGNHRLDRGQLHALQAQQGAGQQHRGKTERRPQQVGPGTARRQGAPQAHRDHGRQVVRAGQGMQEAAHEGARVAVHRFTGFIANMGAGQGGYCAYCYQKQSRSGFGLHGAVSGGG